MSHRAAANRLKAMTKKAKAIRKKHPSMKWSTALKMAGSKTKRATKKSGSSTRRKIKPVASKPKRKSGSSRSRASVGTYLSKAKKMIVEKIGDAESRKFRATTARAKRKVSKVIANLKSQYRKLS